MRKINILYVITKLELGGAQKQLLDCIRQLDQEKFKVFLFTAQEGLLLNDAAAIDGLTIVRSAFLERPIHPLNDLRALSEIGSFIKKNYIDIVHTHSSKAGIIGRWAGRRAGVKIILHTVHGWSFNAFQQALQRKIFICMERISARFSSKIIVVSEHDKNEGLANRVGNAGHYRLIRYGIDLEEFSHPDPAPIKKELGILDNDPVVVMIGCLKPQKAPADFIKVALLVRKDLPQAKFVLVGDGALRPHIERLIKKHRLQDAVILAGWRRDIPQVLAAADVVVLTSLWEGLPIAVLEAMASGKPVVATDTGGLKEVLIDGRTGFLVPPHDVVLMSRKVVSLLKDVSLRKGMGCNARDTLGAEYMISSMARKVQALYEELLQQVSIAA